MTSQTFGNLSRIPSAVLEINISLSASLPDAEAELYMAIKLSHKLLAEFVKYVISALGWRPKTEGELIRGISFTVVKNPS